MKRIWVMGDYAQAETRVVAWRGPVPRLKLWFQEKRDVHLEVAKIVCKVIQENRITMPNNLGTRIPWQTMTKETEPERQILGKTTGHSNNYGLGKTRFALITGLPEKYAELVQTIYHSQFPEIRGNYQRWIQSEIKRDRTVTTPLKRPKTFYDMVGEEMYRAAYAYYPQSTVGDLITQAIVKVCEIFEEVKFDDGVVWTPERIGSAGLDFRINGHDAIYVNVPDDEVSIKFAVTTIRSAGEIPLVVGDDTLVIPMDFKTGYNLGELKNYK